MAGTAAGRRLAVIPELECWDLLATRPWGHLAVVTDDHPEVFPIDHRVEGHTLLLRTEEGSKLRAASGLRVGFEVDEVDEVERVGWSVMVTGYADEVFDLRDLGVDDADEPLWTGERVHWLRVVPLKVTGRRVVAR